MVYKPPKRHARKYSTIQKVEPYRLQMETRVFLSPLNFVNVGGFFDRPLQTLIGVDDSHDAWKDGTNNIREICSHEEM